jgi:hypothetical protein
MKKEMLITSDLKKRGWTDALIRKFLQPPDQTTKNPRYSSKAPMKLYLLTRVVRVERTRAFKQELAKVPERRKRAEKSTATKRAKIQAFIDSLAIHLPSLSAEQLKRAAIDHYNLRGSGLSVTRAESWRPASDHSDAAFLNRICVNFLRHVCTPYEAHLGAIAGATGVHEGYPRIKKKVLEAIALSFPWLEAECRLQALAADDYAALIAEYKQYERESRGIS